MVMKTKLLLSATTLATAVLLAPSLSAQTGSGQTGSGQTGGTQGSFGRTETTGRPAVPDSQDYSRSMERLFQASQRLREAVQAMAQQPAGERRNQAIAQAREALMQTQQAMVQFPARLRTEQSSRDAEARLGEAQRTLADERADPQQARTAVDAYLVLVPRMQADAARLDPSASSTGAPGAGAPAAAGGGAGTGAQTAAATAGLPLQRATSLMGTDLIGPNGQKVAEIENLLVDGAGQVRAFVVEWGGFLGLGDRETLVPVDRVQLGSGNDDRSRTSMTREQLEQQPRFDRDRLHDYGRQYGWGEGLRWYR